MERGDIYHVQLDPVAGREQAGSRYVLIVSPRGFNRLGTQLVCPITQGGQFARDAGFAVPLTGTGTATHGIVLCNQIRALDLAARKARYVESAPAFLTKEVLAKIFGILD